MSAMNPLLKLHDRDNVAIAIQALEAGRVIDDMVIKTEVPLGHKVATVSLRSGDRIYKWGVPIGTTTVEISAGDHVHLHNMKSDYLKTYTLEENSSFVKKSKNEGERDGSSTQ